MFITELRVGSSFAYTCENDRKYILTSPIKEIQ